jgi:glucuronoarabinoxylan endo-1,4-beta-xylanase
MTGGKMPGRFFGVIFFVTAILSGTLYGDVNILTNPGFETGTTSGWAARAGGTIDVSTSPVRSGTYSGQSYNRTQIYQGLKQSILGKLNVGQTCTISGYVRISTASDTVKLSVEKQEAGVTTYKTIQSATGNNTGWTYLSGSYTLNATGTVTVLDIYFEGPLSGVDFYVDDAQVLVPESTVSTTGQINPATHYQYIDGFGAAGAWYGGWLTAHPQKATLYNLLFRDLGLDIYRIRNTYQYSSSGMTTDAEIITQARAVLYHPLKIMISSWSPAASLKSNGSTVRGTLAKDTSGNYVYDDFAQWWVNSLNAYAALGIVADYINMQNEPDWLADWDTCKFTPSETTEWAGYNRAFAALANVAGDMPGFPKLLAPEAVGFGASKSYIDALIDKTPVYAYAHHLYGDGSGSNPDGYISGMANFAAQYNDKPRMQTEFSNTADTGVFADAMNLALLMHNSLTAESVSAYLYWDLFWGTSGGLISLDNPWGSNPSYTINPVYYAFKHYSAYIDAGWRRVAASTDATGLRISAYASPDSHSMTAVIINPSSSTSYNLTFTPSQFSFTGGSIYRSSATENAVLVGSFTPATAITIPVSSITTITMSGTIIPASCAQVQDFGYRLLGDLDGNCQVELADLLLLANQWLSTNPTAAAPNYSPDVVVDDKVTLADFAVIAEQWLACNDPADTACTQNW